MANLRAQHKELGDEILSMRNNEQRIRRGVLERKAARRDTSDLKDILDVRKILRVDDKQIPTSGEKPEPELIIEDLRQPLRRMIAAILLEGKGDFEAIDTQAVSRKVAASPGGGEALRVAAGVTPGIDPVESIVRELSQGDPAYLEIEDLTMSGTSRCMIMDINRKRLLTLAPVGPVPAGGVPGGPPGLPPPGQPPLPPGPPPPFAMPRGGLPGPPPSSKPPLDDLEALLSHSSYKERTTVEAGEELQELLGRQTTKESATSEKFKSKGGPALHQYCHLLTKEDCRRARGTPHACEGLHFVRIIQPHTDINLGDCNYLDTCNHMHTCKRIHYELDPTPDQPFPFMPAPSMHHPALGPPPGSHHLSKPIPQYLQALAEPQWVNCDVRNYDYSTLGKFGVIMADPPWAIHMDLPYGIITDDELRQEMDIACLQDHGVMFLWVTGRAMELGRELLEKWGYKRVEELLWVKINQLQRIIRTGRTGHWLNHSKEHCLVGIKGSPELNKMLDCDVLVAEVRETSRKPDEMYSLLERLSPGTRKLELFGRQHNTQPGWITLGNQLEGVRLVEEDLRKKFVARYPERASELSPPLNSNSMSRGEEESEHNHHM